VLAWVSSFVLVSLFSPLATFVPRHTYARILHRSGFRLLPRGLPLSRLERFCLLPVHQNLPFQFCCVSPLLSPRCWFAVSGRCRLRCLSCGFTHYRTAPFSLYWNKRRITLRLNALAAALISYLTACCVGSGFAHVDIPFSFCGCRLGRSDFSRRSTAFQPGWFAWLCGVPTTDATVFLGIPFCTVPLRHRSAPVFTLTFCCCAPF